MAENVVKAQPADQKERLERVLGEVEGLIAWIQSEPEDVVCKGDYETMLISASVVVLNLRAIVREGREQ